MAPELATPELVADPLGEMSVDEYRAIQDGRSTLAETQAAQAAAAVVAPAPVTLSEEDTKAADEVLAIEADPDARILDPETALGNKKGKLHHRVGQILEGERKAKTAAAALKQQNEELQAKLKALEQAPPPREPTQVAPVAAVSVVAPAAEDLEPNQDDYDGSAGKTYEDFGTAHARWAARDEYRKIETKRAETEAATQARVAEQQAARARDTAVVAHQARTEAVRTEHADYDAVVMKDGLAFTEAMVELFITVDDAGPRVAYHLASTPAGQAELTRISRLTTAQMLVEFGAIKASLTPMQSAAARMSGPAPSAEPVTQHTPPIEPVGSGLTASAVGDPGELSSDDYRKHKDQEYARLRKR